MSESKEPPICRDPVVAKVLAHATQMAEHIMESCGDVPEILEQSTVTVGADFLMDLMDLVLEYGLRYEAEDFEGVHDDLILMYQEQSKRKSGFGAKTVH